MVSHRNVTDQHSGGPTKPLVVTSKLFSGFQCQDEKILFRLEWVRDTETSPIENVDFEFEFAGDPGHPDSRISNGATLLQGWPCTIGSRVHWTPVIWETGCAGAFSSGVLH